MPATPVGSVGAGPPDQLESPIRGRWDIVPKSPRWLVGWLVGCSQQNGALWDVVDGGMCAINA